jgi:hypothetical protein
MKFHPPNYMSIRALGSPGNSRPKPKREQWERSSPTPDNTPEAGRRQEGAVRASTQGLPMSRSRISGTGSVGDACSGP